jgi:hypothetical protein
MLPGIEPEAGSLNREEFRDGILKLVMAPGIDSK